MAFHYSLYDEFYCVIVDDFKQWFLFPYFYWEQRLPICFGEYRNCNKYKFSLSLESLLNSFYYPVQNQRRKMSWTGVVVYIGGLRSAQVKLG
jgi:hypothetical protein